MPYSYKIEKDRFIFEYFGSVTAEEMLESQTYFNTEYLKKGINMLIVDLTGIKSTAITSETMAKAAKRDIELISDESAFKMYFIVSDEKVMSQIKPYISNIGSDRWEINIYSDLDDVPSP